MNTKFTYTKKVRIPHMAQADLVRALMNTDKDNHRCQRSEETRREVCLSQFCTDSTKSLSAVMLYNNKRVS